jgi:hypothetical protein
MDANTFLLELSERGRFWRLELGELSPAERVFRAIWDLETEVNNGGFEQYYSNSAGDTAFLVVDALKTIGAHHAARIVAEASGVFPGSMPPRERDERQAILDSLHEEQRAQLESLDDAFFGYPDDLTGLLFAYVRHNAAGIPGAF